MASKIRVKGSRRIQKKIRCSWRRELTKNAEKYITVAGSLVVPDDILEAIISKLPVKSLFRFKSVSKSWEAIISDPRFSKNYNNRSQNLYLACCFPPLFLPDGSDTFYFMKLKGNKFVVESNLGSPFLGCYPGYSSCNGIVLLFDPLQSKVFTLWNPSTRRHTTIHCPLKSNWTGYEAGLYYNSRSDDYWIIVVCKRWYSIFSCRSRTWREEKEQPDRPRGVGSDPIYFDGCFYWSDVNIADAEVVCFDVRDEKWKIVVHRRADEVMNSFGRCSLDLIVLSGRLCLCRCRRGKLFHISVMEELAWRELMTMDEHEALVCIPVCLTEDDNVVLHKLSSSKFVVYSSRDKEFVGTWRSRALRRSAIIHCSESLAFPFQNTTAGV